MLLGCRNASRQFNSLLLASQLHVHPAALLLALHRKRRFLHLVAADLSAVMPAHSGLDPLLSWDTELLPAGAKSRSMLTESGKQAATFFFSYCLLQVHGIGGALGVWWYSLAAKQGFVYELYGEATCSAHSNALPCVTSRADLLLVPHACYFQACKRCDHHVAAQAPSPCEHDLQH